MRERETIREREDVFGAHASLLLNAARMRSNPTPAEALLWTHIKDGNLDGFKFKNQVALHGAIFDFYCDKYRIAIELDGAGHRAADDAVRDKFMERHCIKTLRFKNVSVHRDTVNVLMRIRKACRDRANP